MVCFKASESFSTFRMDMSTSAMVGSGETDATNLKIQLFKDDR